MGTVYGHALRDKKREEEQSAMGFVDNYTPPLFGLVNDGE